MHSPKIQHSVLAAFACALEEASQVKPPQVKSEETLPPQSTVQQPPPQPTVQMFGFDVAHTHYNPYEQVLNPSNVSRLTQMWSFSTRYSSIDFSSPAVVNGVVYVGSGDKSLYAVDARSGTKLWSFPTGSYIFSSPAVVNGVVYFGSYDHSLYAADARSGSKLWSFPTGDRIYSSPAVVNGVVYVGSYDGKLYAFHLPT